MSLLMLFVPRSVAISAPPPAVNETLSRIRVGAAQRPRRARERGQLSINKVEPADARRTVVEHICERAADGDAGRLTNIVHHASLRVTPASAAGARRVRGGALSPEHRGPPGPPAGLSIL